MVTRFWKRFDWNFCQKIRQKSNEFILENNYLNSFKTLRKLQKDNFHEQNHPQNPRNPLKIRDSG